MNRTGRSGACVEPFPSSHHCNFSVPLSTVPLYEEDDILSVAVPVVELA